MLFAILIFILVLLIAFWHYLQGLFSAGISAVLAIAAALVAVGYHETVVQKLLGGKLADYAHAIVLVCLFAAVYILLRFAFDALVPGNVRFPVLVEKIGAAVFGLVAGTFVAGVVALASHALPFGPSIGMYARYPVETGVAVEVKRDEQAVDAAYDRLKDDSFLKGEPQRMFFPADDWLLSLVKLASADGGPLGRGKPFDRYHPDYLQELFGQRLVQSGSKRCALEGKTAVVGAYVAAGFPNHFDPEKGSAQNKGTGIRAERVPSQAPVPTYKPAKLAAYQPAAGKALLILRTQFNNDDTDEGTNLFAFVPAAIRVCYEGKNYFPIGTLEYPEREYPIVFYSNRVDDTMFTYGDKAADLVFEVPANMLVRTGQSAAIAPGAFLEVKRLAHVDLSNMPILGNEQKALADDKERNVVQVLRKEGLPAKKDERASPPQQAAPPPQEFKLEGRWEADGGARWVEFLPTGQFVEHIESGERKGTSWAITKKEGIVYTIRLKYLDTTRTPPVPTETTTRAEFHNQEMMNYRSIMDDQERTYQLKK